MAKISIIVPVYNVEKYLEKCLKSLVRQTMSDIEIIIVDDGSPDNSERIYRKYEKQDNRIKIIKKQNAGVSMARNTGIEYATGEWLMFVDSDDWMELDGCETLYKEAELNGADMVVADTYVVKEEKRGYIKVFSNEYVFENREMIRKYEVACVGYGYNPMPTGKHNITGIGSPWNKLFKRSIVERENLRFDPYVLGIYDDNLFVLNYLVHCKKISYVSAPVYDYRIISGSLTKGYKKNTLQINDRIFQRIHEFVEKFEKDYMEEFEKAFYIYVIRRLDAALGAYFFSDKNEKKFVAKLKELKKVINTEPYKTAIKNVDVNLLIKRTHEYTCKAARINSPSLIWLSFTLRNTVKKIIACVPGK